MALHVSIMFQELIVVVGVQCSIFGFVALVATVVEPRHLSTVRLLVLVDTRSMAFENNIPLHGTFHK